MNFGANARAGSLKILVQDEVNHNAPQHPPQQIQQQGGRGVAPHNIGVAPHNIGGRGVAPQQYSGGLLVQPCGALVVV